MQYILPTGQKKHLDRVMLQKIISLAYSTSKLISTFIPFLIFRRGSKKVLKFLKQGIAFKQ